MTQTSSSRSSRRMVPVDSSSDTLYQRLRACLTLQSVYRDTIRTLRDSLGNSSMLSHFTSVGSLAQAPTRWVRGAPGGVSSSCFEYLVRGQLRRTVDRGDGGSIPPAAICLCLSEETLKSGGPFCLVSMPGEVKDPI